MSESISRVWSAQLIITTFLFYVMHLQKSDLCSIKLNDVGDNEKTDGQYYHQGTQENLFDLKYMKRGDCFRLSEVCSFFFWTLTLTKYILKEELFQKNATITRMIHFNTQEVV